MRRISSRGTFFTKKVFPVFWFGFLAVFFVIMVVTAVTKTNGPPLPLLLFPIALGGVGFFVMKKQVFDLADEVYDCGEYLLVKRGRAEDQIQLKNVRNVSCSSLQNPPRITLSLREGSRFGTEVSFSPMAPFFSLNPFAKNPVAEELIRRVDEARER